MNFFSWLFIILSTIAIHAGKLYETQEAINLLGFDPSITLIRESDCAVVPSLRKTVYFHGFGANKEAAFDIKHYHGAKRLPGDIVTFNFQDANNGAMNTSHSSLGQWNDIKVALYVLKKLHDSGEKEVGITAHSRGGATAINMVAALINQAGRYDERLKALGIDAATRISIINMLQRGHVVLECPLIDVRAAIQNQITQSSNSWFGAWIVPSVIVESLAYSSAVSVNYVAPLVLQEYRPWAEQARASAKEWKDANIPTIVHFQEKDEVLGNNYDIDFFNALETANGQDYTHFHKGDDGGHNSSFNSFADKRNRFLKDHGGSYKPLE